MRRRDFLTVAAMGGVGATLGFPTFLRVDFFDDRRDFGDLIEADECIHLIVQRTGKVLRKSLGHATGDDELLLLPSFGHSAVLVHLEDVPNGLLL